MHSLVRTGLAALVGMTALSPPAQAEAADVLIRLRGVIVAPTGSAGPIEPAFPGASVSIDNAFAPEVDFTYFFTKHIAAELIAATTKHSATGTGDLDGLKLLDTWVLPPTLTLQYHFLPEGKFHPYVGAGINYTIFYNERAAGSLEDAVGETSVGIHDSVSWALQAGFDFDINERMFINVDFKYINLNTRAVLTTDTGEGSLVNRVDIDLDPIVAGIGIGYRF